MPRVLIIAGPSGVGKSTIARAVAARRGAGAFLSVSATTRPPRPGEAEGIAYRFMSRAQFEEAVARDEFLEWAEYAGHLYGTPRPPVELALAAGKDVILEIDVQGARQVRKKMPEARAVFVEPPSWDVLRSRLGGRGTEDLAALEERIRAAMREVALTEEFDAAVVNDDLDEAVDAVDRLLSQDD